MDIVDFHAHIIPGADHGSSSVEVSVNQLSLAQQSGVTRIVATPHFYPARDSVESFLQRRNRHFAELARENNTECKVRLGAEVLICDNLESMPGLEKLCISGTNTFLLELPFTDFEKQYIFTVKTLIARGFNVVLAHADRYEPENIEKLVSLGAKIQLNASSLVGLFKPKRLYNWMERELVVALGSDIHGADKKYYKNFVTAKNKIGEHLLHIKKRSDEIWDRSKEIL